VPQLVSAVVNNIYDLLNSLTKQTLDSYCMNVHYRCVLELHSVIMNDS